MRRFDWPDTVPTPQPGQIVRAAEIADLCSVSRLKNRLEARLSDRKRLLRRGYFRAMAKGFRIGQCLGMEMAFHQALKEMRTWRQARTLEDEALITLALKIARQLIGEMPEADRLGRIVKVALAEHRQADEMRLCIPAAMPEDIRQAIHAEIMASGMQITLEVDPGDPKNAITLQVGPDRIAIDPDRQLRAIQTALTTRASR
ncbi:hypothetical protein [Thalassococcus sp. S3]|uniref:hypothetical protein n=1 Tax=Thalassococcus sp. S3 TaxID=2017482 RepID=UPI0010242E88|nr:hypothetical protein [Thalassococcus sp. S3]QBF33409.1 hypothetical protein CFI11_19655 [Thalassococcus sp. S3]